MDGDRVEKGIFHTSTSGQPDPESVQKLHVMISNLTSTNSYSRPIKISKSKYIFCLLVVVVVIFFYLFSR